MNSEDLDYGLRTDQNTLAQGAASSCSVGINHRRVGLIICPASQGAATTTTTGTLIQLNLPTTGTITHPSDPSGTITGNIDPVTGVVTESIVLGQESVVLSSDLSAAIALSGVGGAGDSLDIHIGNDTTGPIVYRGFDHNINVFWRIEDVGRLLTGKLFVNVPSGAYNVIVTELVLVD